MSPVTFKLQVEQLVSELSRCIELCQDIRAYRHIGSRHENLDRFQAALESAEGSIPMAYNTNRRLVGCPLEIGDEKSRREMDRYVADLQTNIKPRLQEIARPSRRRHVPAQPGFRELLSQWKAIYQEVSLTMLSLPRRIETGGGDGGLPSEPIIIRSATPTLRKTDEITISLKEFDHLMGHLKNSWEEVLVEGRYRYVNIHHPSTTRSEIPTSGYVKLLPRPVPGLARSSSYERCSPRSRKSSAY